jgi:hypothetical protein
MRLKSRSIKRVNHLESVRKHANTPGFARVEAEFLSFNCVEDLVCTPVLVLEPPSGSRC